MSANNREAWIAEYTAVVEAEVQQAKDAGKINTPFRPFINDYERMGAMICGGIREDKRGHLVDCRRPAVFVSYSVGAPMRSAICEECYRDHIAPNPAGWEGGE